MTQEYESWLDDPRYRENPIYLFLELYVVSVLGKLPEEESHWVDSLKLGEIFDSEATEWREVVEEVLDLSDTIEVAIWHRWVSACNDYYDNHEGHAAFAQDFTDDYMDDDSTVDVWTEASYANAVREIDGFKANAAP
jgi:hypothetical protein